MYSAYSLELDTVPLISLPSGYLFSNVTYGFSIVSLCEIAINYGNKIIKCDNLDLNMVDNIAVAYNNVTVEEENSFMRAKKITMNILTKDINIDSGKQIEITTN